MRLLEQDLQVILSLARRASEARRSVSDEAKQILADSLGVSVTQGGNYVAASNDTIRTLSVNGGTATIEPRSTTIPAGTR